MIVRFEGEGLLLLDRLQYFPELKLLVEGCMLSGILCDLCLVDFVIVLELNERILLAKGVGVLEGAQVDYLKLQEAIAIHFGVRFGHWRRNYEPGLEGDGPRFLALVVVELELVDVLLLIQDEINERHALGLAQRVVGVDVVVECFQNEALARFELVVEVREAESLVELWVLSGVVLRVGAYLLIIIKELDVRILLPNKVSILEERCLHDYDLEEAG